MMTIDDHFFSFMNCPVIKVYFWEFKRDVGYKRVFLCKTQGDATGEIVFIRFFDIVGIDAVKTIGDGVPNRGECFEIQFFYNDINIF